jgi:hypothetical protein
MIKSRRIKQMGHAAQKSKQEMHEKFWLAALKGKDYLGDNRYWLE